MFTPPLLMNAVDTDTLSVLLSLCMARWHNNLRSWWQRQLTMRRELRSWSSEDIMYDKLSSWRFRLWSHGSNQLVIFTLCNPTSTCDFFFFSLQPRYTCTLDFVWICAILCPWAPVISSGSIGVIIHFYTEVTIRDI